MEAAGPAASAAVAVEIDPSEEVPSASSSSGDSDPAFDPAFAGVAAACQDLDPIDWEPAFRPFPEQEPWHLEVDSE